MTFSSAPAREAVEKAGGAVKHVYHNARALRAHLRPESFAEGTLPRTNGLPPPRLRYRYRGHMEFRDEQPLGYAPPTSASASAGAKDAKASSAAGKAGNATVAAAAASAKPLGSAASAS